MATGVALKSLATGTLFDLAGNALSGRAVYVYTRGTTTQAPVYQDVGLTTPYTQPVVTGSDGVAGTVPGYVGSGVSVDFVDVLSGARTQAEPLLAPSGTGAAWILVLHNAPLNVEWPEYGADPAASAAANTTAIQAAISALPAAGGTILLPRLYPANGIVLDSLEGVVLKGMSKWGSGLNIAGSGNVGINVTAASGTGGVKDIGLEDLQVNYTGTNTTALRVWNCQSFNAQRCIFYSDYLPGNIQGSFVGALDACEFYLTGANAAPIAALWIGSGKSAPHTGSVTLSGCGAFTFDGCLIESFNKGSAIIIEENTFPLHFRTCQLLAKGGTVSMVQVDGPATQATFAGCYSEASNNAAADFAIGVAEGSCGYFTCRDYQSTGSAGQNYAFDVAACRRLLVEKCDCINYTLGVLRLRTGYLPTGGNDNQVDIRLTDTGAATGQPIYIDDDANIASTYRGPVMRTKQWRHLLTRVARFDAAVVTGAGTYPLAQSNPTAAGTGDANEGLAWFYLDPADYGYAPLRVRMSVLTNATAPGVNINGGIVPTSGNPAGGAAAVTQANAGFVMASALVSTPALSTRSTSVSAIGYVTTAGWYALAVSPAGAFAASSAVAVALRLEALS
jgi:hypothetical protein